MNSHREVIQNPAFNTSQTGVVVREWFDDRLFRVVLMWHVWHSLHRHGTSAMQATHGRNMHVQRGHREGLLFCALTAALGVRLLWKGSFTTMVDVPVKGVCFLGSSGGVLCLVWGCVVVGMGVP